MSGLLEGKQLVSDGTRDSNSEPTSLTSMLYRSSSGSGWAGVAQRKHVVKEKSRSLSKGAWEMGSLKGEWEKTSLQRRMRSGHRKKSQKGEWSWQPRKWNFDKERIVGWPILQRG